MHSPPSPLRAVLLGWLFLAGTALAAGTPIQESRPVNPDARIDVSNVKGTVNIRAWDKAEIAISGTLGEGAKGLAIAGDARQLTIKVQPPDRQGWSSWGADTRMGNTVLDLKVPESASLSIHVVSADVTVAGVAGQSLAINSISGKLQLDSHAQDIKVNSVSGALDLTGNATRARLETVSGAIRVR